MDVPRGFRFLIQLVDAETMQGVRESIRGMYGERCSSVCVIVPGSEPMKSKSRKMEFGKSDKGYTVFVPVGFKV